MITHFDPGMMPTLLAGWYLKGLIIMLIATLTLLAVRKRNPRLAAALSTGAMIATLALPLAGALLPQWQWEIPGWRNQTAPASTPEPGLTAPPLQHSGPVTDRSPLLYLPAGASATPAPSMRQDSAGQVAPGYALPEPATVVMLIWLIGVLVVLDRQLRAHTDLCRSIRHGREAPQRIRRMMQRCVTRIGLQRTPRCLICADIRVPLVCGWIKPVVLLPEVARFWNDERLHIILTHELCHLRRGDWLMQQITHFACALHWANPLMWWLERQLHLQRERACDADVVSLGASASRYAEHLVAVARRVIHNPSRPAMAPAAVGGSDLEERIMSLIDGRKLRQSAVFSIITGSLLGVTLAACAAVNPVPQASAAETPAPDASATAPTPAASPTPSASSRPAPVAKPARPAKPAKPARPAAPSTPRAPAPPAPDGQGHYQFGDDMSLTVSSEGELEISAQPPRIEAIAAGGWFEIKTREDNHSNRLRASADDRGEIRHDWYVDGQRQPFDERGERWLAAALEAWQRIERAEAVAAEINAEVAEAMASESWQMMEMNAEIGEEMAAITLEDAEMQALIAEISEESAAIAAEAAILAPEREELTALANELTALALKQVSHAADYDEQRHEELARQLEQRSQELQERMQDMEMAVEFDESRLRELETRLHARMAEIDFEEKARQLDAQAREMDRVLRESGFEERMREMEARLAEMQERGNFDDLEGSLDRLRQAMNATRT